MMQSGKFADVNSAFGLVLYQVLKIRKLYSPAETTRCHEIHSYSQAFQKIVNYTNWLGPIEILIPRNTRVFTSLTNKDSH